MSDLNAEIERRQAIADCGPMIHRETTRALKLAVAALGSIQTNATEWADSDKIIIEAMEALAAIKRALEAK